jgi:hypothetical protein
MDNTQKWLRQHGRDSELNLSEVLNVLCAIHFGLPQVLWPLLFVQLCQSA